MMQTPALIQSIGPRLPLADGYRQVTRFALGGRQIGLVVQRHLNGDCIERTYSTGRRAASVAGMDLRWLLAQAHTS
jgi:hypothetical protein